MGKGGTTINAPTPPDPYATANAQFGQNFMSNLANIYGNRIEQSTPYGSISYDTSGYMAIDPKTGQMKQVDKMAPVPVMRSQKEWEKKKQGFADYNAYRDDFRANTTKYMPIQTQKVTLSPEQQKLLDLQSKQNLTSGNINNSALSRVGSAMGKEFSTRGMAAFDPSVANKDFRIASFAGNPALQSRYATQDLSFAGNPALQSKYATQDLSFADNPKMTGAGDYSKDRTRIEDALYGRLDRKMSQDDEALRTRLANQGITAGSEAYKREMANANDAKTDARMQVIAQGGAEQSRLVGLDAQARQMANNEDMARNSVYNQNRQQLAEFQNNSRQMANNEDMARNSVYNQNRQQLAQFQNQARSQANSEDMQLADSYNNRQSNAFNQDLQKSQFQNQTRGQQMQEGLALRQLPLTEYNALRSGQQIQNPTFNGFYQSAVQGGDVQGAIGQNYQGQLGIYNQKMAQKNAGMEMFGQLGGAAIQAAPFAFSDARLKENVSVVGKVGQFNMYMFNYLWDNIKRLGVMAQDILQIYPDLVHVHENGYYMVDYHGLNKRIAS